MYDMHWLRIFRRLAYFDGHVPSGVVSIAERYVDDYHKLLGELEHLSGLSLDSYKISKCQLEPVAVVQDSDGSQVTYTSQRFVDTSVLKSKFTALAKYFDQKFAEL